MGPEFSTSLPVRDVVKRFDEIFDEQLAADERAFNLKDRLSAYRSLKETLRCQKFREEELDEKDVVSLVGHLLDSERYGEAFRNWVATRALHIDHKTLPRNTYLVASFARSEIQRRATLL